jgi:hypothetical protein
VGLAQINLVVLAFEVKSHRFGGCAAVEVIDEPYLGHACHAKHFHPSVAGGDIVECPRWIRKVKLIEHFALRDSPAVHAAERVGNDAAIATDFMRSAAATPARRTARNGNACSVKPARWLAARLTPPSICG